MLNEIITELTKIDDGIRLNSGKKIPYSDPAYDQLIEDFSAQNQIFKKVDPQAVDYDKAHSLVITIDNELTALYEKEQILGSFDGNLGRRPPLKRL